MQAFGYNKDIAKTVIDETRQEKENQEILVFKYVDFPP